MKRLFWIGVGVAATVVVLRQVTRVNDRVGEAVHAVSPAGIAESITSLAASVREAGAQLRTSMAEHEAALAEALLPSADDVRRAQQVRDARGRHRARDGATGPDDLDLDDPDYF